jgi:hypothetical protein
MLQTVEGRYENGRVLIKEKPAGIRRARVLVTFIDEEFETETRSFRDLSTGERASRVAEIQRRWKDRLSSSDEFARAKAEEIELEERRRGDG